MMKKIHKEILMVALFLLFLGYAFSFWTFAGIIGKDQARTIIRDFERSYLYQNTLNTPEYGKMRDGILSGAFTSKKKLEGLMSYAFKQAGDQESQIFYVDILQGKVSKSKIENLKFKKKVVNGTAYIQINVFNTKLIPILEKALDKYEGKYKNIILDLRGTSFGDMNIAAMVADEFVGADKELCTFQGALATNTVKSDVFDYKFDKIYVFLDKESGAPAEMLALSLQQNMSDKVVLVGNSTKQKNTAFADRKYSFHFGTSVAASKWTVNGYNSEAIQSLLKQRSYPELNKLDDYMGQVK